MGESLIIAQALNMIDIDFLFFFQRWLFLLLPYHVKCLVQTCSTTTTTTVVIDREKKICQRTQQQKKTSIAYTAFSEN